MTIPTAYRSTSAPRRTPRASARTWRRGPRQCRPCRRRARTRRSASSAGANRTSAGGAADGDGPAAGIVALKPAEAGTTNSRHLPRRSAGGFSGGCRIRSRCNCFRPGDDLRIAFEVPQFLLQLLRRHLQVLLVPPPLVGIIEQGQRQQGCPQFQRRPTDHLRHLPGDGRGRKGGETEDRRALIVHQQAGQAEDHEQLEDAEAQLDDAGCREDPPQALQRIEPREIEAQSLGQEKEPRPAAR